MNKVVKEKLLLFFVNSKALIIFVVLCVLAQISSKGLFFTYGNLSSVFRQVAVSSIVGAGFTAVLAGGGIDLSVGNMVSLLGIIYASLSLYMPLPVALVLAILSGAFCGTLNGCLSEGLKLPAFIITLATGQIFKGIAYLITNGKTVNNLDEGIKYLGQGLIGNWLPVPIVVMLVVSACMAVVLYKTKLGRYIIAVGGNSEAASVSGINVKVTRTMVYVLIGICAAIGSAVLTGRVSMAAPAAGEGMEMDIVAAVVIGGTPMSGGKAKVGGTIFGCLIMGIIGNLLNLLGVSSFWQWVAKGAIIILAIFMDAQTEQFFNRKRHRAAME